MNDSMPTSSPRKSLLVIAGEISGDEHAARLVRELRTMVPDLDVYGIGGEALRGEGMELLYHVKDMAVIGIWEVIRRFLFFRRVFKDMVALARDRRPDAVLLVDYPGFNLKLAEKTHAMGIKTVYYICPKVWVWKASRIPRIAETCDRLMTIFPFEPELFDGTGLQVDFVGHPLLDHTSRVLDEAPTDLGWQSDLRIALLPGSRANEIIRILPVIWEAARIIEERHPGVSYILPSPTEAVEQMVKRTIATLPPGPTRWSTVVGQTHHVLRQARAALVVSGTATLDTSLMNCPMVITYRVNAITAAIGRRVIKIDYVGLVNIIANREVCPELLQEHCNAPELVEALLPLIDDTPERQAMLQGIAEVNTALGAPGASRRAAELVAEELGT